MARQLVRKRLALVVGTDVAAAAEFVRRRCACRRAWAGDVEGASTKRRTFHGPASCLPVRRGR